MEYIDELENMASALCDRPELEADDDTVAGAPSLYPTSSLHRALAVGMSWSSPTVTGELTTRC